MKKKSTIFLIALIIILMIATCAIVWRYGSYYGKVIDGETKKPLEGAAVLAVYYTEGGGFSGARSYYVDAQETLTDKNGEFKIPANIIITFRFLHGWPKPHFQIYKPGYGNYPRHKDAKPMFVPNGTLPANEYLTIELPKLKTRKERLMVGWSQSRDIPIIKYRNLQRLRNEEWIALGLKPIREP